MNFLQAFEQKQQDLELALIKVWRERFAARSERYIADPAQMQLDFGDTYGPVDAATGLAESVEEADLIPAHQRRKPRKKREDKLPRCTRSPIYGTKGLLFFRVRCV